MVAENYKNYGIIGIKNNLYFTTEQYTLVVFQ